MPETHKTFHGCFIVVALVFYFKCATAEIKHCFLSVFFQFYISFYNLLFNYATRRLTRL